MIKFLVFIVIILVVYAISCIVKIYKLASGLKGNKPPLSAEDKQSVLME